MFDLLEKIVFYHCFLKKELILMKLQTSKRRITLMKEDGGRKEGSGGNCLRYLMFSLRCGISLGIDSIEEEI